MQQCPSSRLHSSAKAEEGRYRSLFRAWPEKEGWVAATILALLSNLNP